MSQFVLVLAGVVVGTPVAVHIFDSVSVSVKVRVFVVPVPDSRMETVGGFVSILIDGILVAFEGFFAVSQTMID
jgi:hypothetical protein